MKKCKKINASIIDYYNGLLDSKSKKETEIHLSSCRNCMNEFENYAALINLAKKRKRQSPSKAFDRMTWAEIKNRKESEMRERISFLEKIGAGRLYKSPFPVPVLTATAFLVIGLFIGWIVFSPSGEDISNNYVESQKSIEMQDIAYKERAEKLIDKSKILIIGLANYDPAKEDISVLNLRQSRKLSEDYLKEAVFLGKNMNSTRQAKLKRLIEDLEFILMQIASLENEDDLGSVEILKKGIDGRGILLKINLDEINRMERSSDKTNKFNKSVI